MEPTNSTGPFNIPVTNAVPVTPSGVPVSAANGTPVVQADSVNAMLADVLAKMNDTLTRISERQDQLEGKSYIADKSLLEDARSTIPFTEPDSFPMGESAFKSKEAVRDFPSLSFPLVADNTPPPTRAVFPVNGAPVEIPVTATDVPLTLEERVSAIEAFIEKHGHLLTGQ